MQSLAVEKRRSLGLDGRPQRLPRSAVSAVSTVSRPWRGRIVVYQCRGTWTIWLGGEQLGERATRASAIEVAGDVAAARRRPAWLLDETGYPLKLIGCAGKG